jgi:hypothetical protein
LRILEFIEDSSSDVFDEAFELDGVALIAEVSAAFIAGVRRKEGAIGGEDGESQQTQELGDLD